MQAQEQFKSQETNPKRKNFRIYKTILEILEARGYAIADEKKQMTFEQYQQNEFENTRQTEVFQMIGDDDQDDNEMEDQGENPRKFILVYYNPKKYNPKPDPMEQKTIENLIMTSNAKKFFLVAGTENKGKVPGLFVEKKVVTYVESICKEKQIEIQLFRDEDLMFNVLKHDLVPEHKVLSVKQKEELLRRYKVKESQLPKILLTDPVARFLGLKRGNVVKINRKSETAGTYTTYRIAL